MSGEISNGLEGALHRAIASSGAGEAGAGAPDYISLFIKVLPNLLKNTDEREKLVELQKEGISALHKEMKKMRRRLQNIEQTQRESLEERRLMGELLRAVVNHLARVQIIEYVENDDETYEDIFEDDDEAYAEDLFEDDDDDDDALEDTSEEEAAAELSRRGRLRRARARMRVRRARRRLAAARKRRLLA